ncbi:MAG: DUF167 domain-containing protein [Chloroflexi bacterium]|nr:DUF167 domain-containing protein [Chloroflexota bacterium]
MTRFTVRVHPGARNDRLELTGVDRLEVWTKARAVEGRANEAVCKLIAEWQGVPPSSVRVVQGARSRTKIVEIMEAG